MPHYAKALAASLATIIAATTLTACDPGAAFDTPYNSVQTSHHDTEPHYNGQPAQTQTDDYDLYEGTAADVDHVIDGDTIAVVLPGQQEPKETQLQIMSQG